MLNKKGQLIEDAFAAVFLMFQQQEHPKRPSIRPPRKGLSDLLITITATCGRFGTLVN